MEKKLVARSFVNDALKDTDISPLLRRIYAARGVRTADDINLGLDQLYPPSQLLQIDAATQRLALALEQQQRILIVGDFDADGATSTALVVSALRRFGAEQVDYIVPDRFTYGYGLTPAIVEVAGKKNPDLIITVDNGISSAAGVAKAHALGIDVLVTDHHLPGEQLPEPCIIVNPNQSGDAFPSKNLAGVGVIFYVMCALRAHLQKINWFSAKNIAGPKMTEFLDLVALGTVADVVALDKNNRILVKQGLARIQRGKCREGISALISVAGRSQEKLCAADLGFALGPRLNAAGRLQDMSVGIACLLSEEKTQAQMLAQQLDQLNKERREIEKNMKDEAFVIVKKLNLTGKLPSGLCLHDASWHQGVVGLVASRVKEKYNRPVIAFANVDDENLKGSARSIVGLHIKDVLDRVATKYPYLIDTFGGHAQAAGLAIKEKHLNEFSQAFAGAVREQLGADIGEPMIETDGELATDNFNLQIAQQLRAAGPWGQAFPEPIFVGVFNVIEQRLVGTYHLKLTLAVPKTGQMLNAIYFNVNPDEWPQHRLQTLKIAYRLDINEFRQRRSLQLMVEGMGELSAVAT